MSDKQQGRTKKSIRNIMFEMGNQVVVLILNFVFRYVFLRCLNESYLGVNVLFGDILFMLSLADLGLTTTMAYSFYQPLADHDEERIKGLIIYYKKLYRIVTAVIALIGLLIIPFLTFIVSVEDQVGNLYLYYLLFLLRNLLSYYQIYKISLLNADQKNYLVSIISMLSRIFILVIEMVVLWITKNYVNYLLLEVCFQWITNYLCGKWADKQFPYLVDKQVKPLPVTKSDQHRLTSLIKAGFIYKVSGILINSTDSTIISVMLGTGMVGLFSNYSIITTRMSGFLTLIFTAMTGSIGNLLTTRESKKNTEVYYIMQYICCGLACVAIPCTYLLMEDFIALWLGTAYLLDKSVLICLLTNFYLSICMRPLWVFREASGIYEKTKYVMLICAIENIILSVLLGYYMGLAGIILASAVSRLSTYFWYEPFILFRSYFNESPSTHFVMHLLTMSCSIVGSMGLEKLLINFKVTSWMQFIEKGVVSVLLCGTGFLLLTGLSKSMRYSAKSLFYRIVRKDV